MIELVRARCTLVLTLASLWATPSCRDDAPARPVASEPVAKPSAPSSLVATFVVPAPQRTYEWIKQNMGQGTALPFQLPVLLAHQLGLPPLSSGRFAVHAPMFGAVGLDGQRVEWALGFRVQSGAELVAELSTGAEARFERVDRGSSTLLRGATRTLAVVDSYLIVGSNEVALERYAAYVARGVSWDPLRSRDVEVALELSPGSGEHFDQALGASFAAAANRFQDWLLAESRLRGSPDLVDAEELLGLVEHLARLLRTGVRGVSGGALTVIADEQNVRATGTLRVDGPRAVEPSDAALCESVLQARRGTIAGLVLPQESFSASGLARLERALSIDQNGSIAAPRLQALAPALKGPALLALGVFGEEREWTLQGHLASDDEKSLGAPLALLWAPLLRRQVAPQIFPERFDVTSPAGALRSSGTEPAWEVAWLGSAGLTSWAFGVDASRWLQQDSSERLDDVFPSWRVLCRGRPLFAAGFRGSGGVADAAISLGANQVDVETRLPLELLVEALEGDASRRRSVGTSGHGSAGSGASAGSVSTAPSPSR